MTRVASSQCKVPREISKKKLRLCWKLLRLCLITYEPNLKCKVLSAQDQASSYAIYLWSHSSCYKIQAHLIAHQPHHFENFPHESNQHKSFHITSLTLPQLKICSSRSFLFDYWASHPSDSIQEAYREISIWNNFHSKIMRIRKRFSWRFPKERSRKKTSFFLWTTSHLLT